MDKIFSLEGCKIWVAGETGLVGRAVVRALQEREIEVLSAPHAQLDLTNQKATHDWLCRHKPDVIVMAAGRVGGIGANMQDPAGFISDNLAIAHNVIDGAHKVGVQNLLYLGSSCIYPKEAAQPMGEEALMSGPLEPTNEGYAIAKIAGLKLCEFYTKQYGRRYIAAMPTNLYGPWDRFDVNKSHVIPAMMMKFHAAKMERKPFVTLWGTGAALREFLHVDDLAAALIVMLERYEGQGFLNIGSGHETSIQSLAVMMKKVTGFDGAIVFNDERPDGTMRKFLDSSRINALGWAARRSLEEGLAQTYQWYCAALDAELRRRA